MMSPAWGFTLLIVRVNWLKSSDHDTDWGAASAAPAPVVTAKPAATTMALVVPTARRILLPVRTFPVDDAACAVARSGSENVSIQSCATVTGATIAAVGATVLVGDRDRDRLGRRT